LAPGPPAAPDEALAASRLSASYFPAQNSYFSALWCQHRAKKNPPGVTGGLGNPMVVGWAELV